MRFATICDFALRPTGRQRPDFAARCSSMLGRPPAMAAAAAIAGRSVDFEQWG
jgi:hypothetical protein